MTSYDVKALLISVPMDLFINIVKQKLPQDPLLQQRIYTTNNHITASKRHMSSSKVSIMNRSMVLAWFPPLALSLPTCLWKSLKLRPLALPQTPCLWLRYVDGTFDIQEAKHSWQLLQHINS